MKIVSSEFEQGRVYFKQFGAERVKIIGFQLDMGLGKLRHIKLN